MNPYRKIQEMRQSYRNAVVIQLATISVDLKPTVRSVLFEDLADGGTDKIG